MNVKDIFVLCFAINYLVTKSVADETEEERQRKIQLRDYIFTLSTALATGPVVRSNIEQLEDELMNSIFSSILHIHDLPDEPNSTINLNMFRNYVNDADLSKTILNNFYLDGTLSDITKSKMTRDEFKNLIRSASALYEMTVNEFTEPLNAKFKEHFRT
ncbi:uncharacterized protein LOC126841214 [Adelges cooleyi]|uniref:uncharacterized protein LOC126841214 n=1 Tax=Adelges cooleyi TaxID=133065 RepID=UPI00217FC0C6|nr:uncharacterized protein LOC126841214 [Adelges cooleyi]XP_050433497.1 uncharacterized protein LOC126841214 [Adelges cooleyi]